MFLFAFAVSAKMDLLIGKICPLSQGTKILIDPRAIRNRPDLASALNRIERANDPISGIKDKLFALDMLASIFPEFNTKKVYVSYLRRLHDEAMFKLDKQEDLKQSQNYFHSYSKLTEFVDQFDSLELFRAMPDSPLYVKIMTIPSLLSEKSYSEKGMKILAATIYFFHRVITAVLKEFRDLLRSIVTSEESVLTEEDLGLFEDLIASLDLGNGKEGESSRHYYNELLLILVHVQGLPTATDIALMLIAIQVVVEKLPDLKEEKANSLQRGYDIFIAKLTREYDWPESSVGYKLFGGSRVRHWRNLMLGKLQDLSVREGDIGLKKIRTALNWNFIDISLTEGKFSIEHTLHRFKENADLLGIENWPFDATQGIVPSPMSAALKSHIIPNNGKQTNYSFP
jgi:hypothetical protein